jgi:hypothetical protein
VWAEGSRDLPQTTQVNSGILPEIMEQLSSESIPIRYSYSALVNRRNLLSLLGAKCRPGQGEAAI